MKRLSIQALALLAIMCHTLPATAQTQLQKYMPGATPEGAVYCLPKTAVRITVVTEKTTFQPGEFCRYAQKYLRRSDAGQEPWVSHRVLTIRQTPEPVADTSKCYALKFDPRSVAVNMQLSDDGRLLGINTGAPLRGTTATSAQDFLSQVGGQKGTAKTVGPSPRSYLTEEILSAGSTAKMAELTASEIYDLRENRSLLIKGQADFMPKDGEQLRLMLSRIDEQEQALSSLFVGTTIRDTVETDFVIVPDHPCDRTLLFRMSQLLGMVDADDLSGEPFYITIEDLHAIAPTDEEAAAKTKKKAWEAGVYVNVPGRMRLTIYQGIDKLQTAEHPAPQFGNVELLSGELFNKHYDTRLWLNALTGAVERLEAEMPKK